MANCEHASIDVKRLAASLRENLETVQSLSEECCIYRVPQQTRCLNESDFTPQVISIGPLHHGKSRTLAPDPNLSFAPLFVENFALFRSLYLSLSLCLSLSFSL